MIAARVRVLDGGVFDPLVGRVREIGLASLAASPTSGPASAGDAPRAVLDCGCGTGHYLQRLARPDGVLAGPDATTALTPTRTKTDQPPPGELSGRVCYLGTDISRAALRRAARTLPAGVFFRNDVAHRISVRSHSVHLILNIFAPRNPQEFHRVLHPDGELLVVVPGADHLAQLRGQLPLLTVAPDKAERVSSAMRPQFELAAGETVRYDSTLEPSQLLDLLRMTPNAWHLDDAAWSAAARLAPLRITFHFDLLVLRPASGDTAAS